MNFIDKSESAEPESLVQWKASEDNNLQIWYQDDAQSGGDIWGKLPGDIKNDLRKTLVEDQGFICCYCGSRIENDHHTSIEHLVPKSVEKIRTFEFENLVASCSGGSRIKIHIVRQGESLGAIAEQYSLKEEELLALNTSPHQLQQFGRSFDFPWPKVIVQVPMRDSLHCDSRKGDRRIEILPTQRNCSSFFSYDKLTGRIIETEENRNTVDCLGLNANAHLIRNRLKTINSAIALMRLMMKKPLTREDIEKAIKSYKLKKEGKFQPYFYVAISVLR